MTYSIFEGERPVLVINPDCPDAETKKRAVFAGRLLTTEMDTPASFEPHNFEPVEIPLAAGTTPDAVAHIMNLAGVERL